MNEEKAPGRSSSGAFLALRCDRFRQDKEERGMLDNTRLRIAIQKFQPAMITRIAGSGRGMWLNLHTQRPIIFWRKTCRLISRRVRDDDIPVCVIFASIRYGRRKRVEEELLNRRARRAKDPRHFTLRRLDFGGRRFYRRQRRG